MKFHWTSTPYDNCFRSRAVWLKQAKSRIEYKVGDPSKKKDKRNTTHIHKTAWAKGSKQPYLTALGLWTPPVCCASVFSQLAFRLHFRSEIPYISNICSSKAGRPWASSQQIVEGKKYITVDTLHIAGNSFNKVQSHRPTSGLCWRRKSDWKILPDERVVTDRGRKGSRAAEDCLQVCRQEQQVCGLKTTPTQGPVHRKCCLNPTSLRGRTFGMRRMEGTTEWIIVFFTSLECRWRLRAQVGYFRATSECKTPI